MSFKVGDAVIRKFNGRVYYVVADVDCGAEFLVADKPYTPISKCKVCEIPENLSNATPEEIAAGYRIDTPQLEVLEMIDVSPNCEVSEL